MIITFIKNGIIETIETTYLTKQNYDYAERFNNLLKPLAEKAKEIIAAEGIKYDSFLKEKRKGGYREIHNPDEDLKKFMKEINKTFTEESKFIFPNCMYAYIHGRGIKQYAYLHKDSDFIIKMDIKDFFDSCTLEFIKNSMSKVYPFCLLDENLLNIILEACTLDGHLVQGAPTSPFLSNIAIIPAVFEMSKKFLKFNQVKFSIYADDITISFCKKEHCCEATYERLITRILDIVDDAIYCRTPLEINNEKTKIIYNTDGVWITGLMVTHNRVTIGHKNKQFLKAMIYNFLADFRDGKPWSVKKVQCLIGKLAFFRYIEPIYVQMTIEKYQKKTGQDFIFAIESIMN